MHLIAECELAECLRIYFLKDASRLDSIPENLGEVSEIEKALNIANRINLTTE